MLTDALPDLNLLIRRDGIVLAHFGGRALEWLRPAQNCDGLHIAAIWPATVAGQIKQLTSRAIADRGTVSTQVRHGERRCEIRVTAQSPDRAICVIRASSHPQWGDSAAPGTSNLERRGFLRRFKESIALAALNERPIAVAIVHLDGLTDVARVLDTKVSDQVINTATRRLEKDPGREPEWYMGQLSESLLAVVLETTTRELIEACVTRICDSLRLPIRIGDAEFHLTPYAGAAILGKDATSPKLLLEHARASAVEARRSGDTRVCFFSDTLELRSLARIDITRELRGAIANREIRLRYVGRHDLTSGRLVTVVGYLQWIDPMRGEVRPADFLSIAEATGLSASLSRSVLACLREDFEVFKSQLEPDVRISFGALRQHVLSDSFLADVQAALVQDGLSADRLELRIAERAYVSREVDVWRTLASMGVQLVVDEFGRQMSSFDLLARVPLWGLQLDRSWATAVNVDPVARRVCGAVMNVASGLGLTPIATGIDYEERRQLLRDLGCRQGLGDLYGVLPLERPSSSSAGSR